MRVAQGIHSQAGEKVQIPFAIDVKQVDAFAAGERNWVAGVSVEKVLLLKGNDFLIRRHGFSLPGYFSS